MRLASVELGRLYHRVTISMFTRLAFDSYSPGDGDELRRLQGAHSFVGGSLAAGLDSLGNGSHLSGGSREFDDLVEQSLQRVTLPGGLLARLHASVEAWND